MESTCFAFQSSAELISSLNDIDTGTIEQIQMLAERGLPPVTSMEVLASMLGVNAGIIWSFANRTHRHYRTFTIPKGQGQWRTINAPRVALKVLQTWLAHHLSNAYAAPAHVFGFVRGRSHIDAAKAHANAEWAYSVDIENFFGSTPALMVEGVFRKLGYDHVSANLLASLTCLKGYLSQGSPASPTLSNLCFSSVDQAISDLATSANATVTRYADDIVFSGKGSCPEQIPMALAAILSPTPWAIRPNKTRLEPVKGRIKVHGLVVGGGRVRLTKGYRNKIRAYAHVLRTNPAPEGERKLLGHVQYAKQVTKLVGPQAGLNNLDAKYIPKDTAYIPAAGIHSSVDRKVYDPASERISKLWPRLKDAFLQLWR